LPVAFYFLPRSRHIASGRAFWFFVAWVLVGHERFSLTLTLRAFRRLSHTRFVIDDLVSTTIDIGQLLTD
jgi:hypothetical protein